MKCDVTVNTKGLQDLQSVLIKNKKSIRVGILGSSNNRTDGLSNATIGAIQEFGSEGNKIPARSFLRMPIMDKQKQIAQFAKKSLTIALKTNNIDLALNQIGLFCRSIIQNAFDTKGFGKWSPNAPTTIENKGSSSPLIDTGELRKSITHDIINNK